MKYITYIRPGETRYKKELSYTWKAEKPSVSPCHRNKGNVITSWALSDESQEEANSTRITLLHYGYLCIVTDAEGKEVDRYIEIYRHNRR